jgi:putative membrane protein
MRNLLMHGLVLATLAVAACGGEDKPAVDPSTAYAPPAPAPAPTPPMAESMPATSDPRPIEESMGGGTNAGNDATPVTPATSTKAPMTDGDIVKVTSTANSGEIQMAELATKKATNPAVKSYATMMIAQHKDMEAKGKALSTKEKITPSDNDASSTLKTDVDSTMSTLKTENGKAFDKAYMDAQVKAHRDVLDLFDNKLLPSAQNRDLKTLLTDGRSHVAAHLAKAEEIQQKLDSSSSVTPPTKPQVKPPVTPPKSPPKPMP